MIILIVSLASAMGINTTAPSARGYSGFVAAPGGKIYVFGGLCSGCFYPISGGIVGMDGSKFIDFFLIGLDR